MQGKQRSLAQAVSEGVKAGDTVHLVFSHNRSHAAVWEVARQFRDQHSLRLVNTYPSPSPSRVLIEHFAADSASDPNWTKLTMTLRLMAGALGGPLCRPRVWPAVTWNTGRGASTGAHCAAGAAD